jgi:hypothetical protein
MKLKELRIVEKKINDLWFRCRLMNIKKGDIFRMTENEIISKPYVALGDPFLNENNIATIVCDI